ncbi:hypothetical protein ACFQX8_19310 [Klenkia terrae]|uniref:hypothetical protein n=1 Tax=Klenkia terrae TaxID=1052259 RepID=UPI00361375BC
MHLVDPQGVGGRGSDWVLHRTGLLPEEVTRRGAYLLTGAARTVVDVARTWSEVDAVAAADAALLRGLTTKAELLATLDRHATVAGTPAVRRVLDLADGRAESWLETCGRLAFAAGGLPVRAAGRDLAGRGAAQGGRRLVPRDRVGRRVRRADQVPGDGGGGATHHRGGEAGGGPAALVRHPVRAGHLPDAHPGVDAAPGPRAAGAGGGRPPARAFEERPRSTGKVRGGVQADDGWLWRAQDAVGGPGGPTGTSTPALGA